MMDSNRRIALISLILLFCIPPASRAHEEVTHQLLGDFAVLYLGQNLPNRPKLTGSLVSLRSTLRVGAAGEDDDPFPDYPRGIIGRYYFHFAPELNFSETGLLLSGTNQASCSSLQWGLHSSTSNCAFTCSVRVLFSQKCDDLNIPENNQYEWSQDLVPDSSGAPSTQSVQQLGYVVHLLEDLGSPAHTHNDLHACPYQQIISDYFPDVAVPSSIGGYPLPYCDAFEKGNVGRLISQPSGSQIIDTTAYSTPDEFFEGFRAYTNTNYFSNGRAFTSSGPALVTQDDHYFYGACIEATVRYGHCESVNGQNVRKIASKGPLYYAICKNSQDPSCDQYAGVNLTVAQEQFDELGPVIAQHVAAFLQFYSPELTISTQGTGTGKVLSTPGDACTTSSMPCSSLLTRTTDGPASVVLTAEADPGSTFVSWSGASGCSGKNPSITLSVDSDATCSAVFAIGQSEQAEIGYGPAVYDVSVTYSGGCTPTPPFHYSSVETITAKSLRTGLPLIKTGNLWQPATVSVMAPTEIAYPYPTPIFNIVSSINPAGIVTTVETGGPFTYTGTFDKDVYQSVTVQETIDLNTGAYHRVQDESWMVVPITNQGCQSAVSEHGITTDTGTLAITLVPLANLGSQQSAKTNAKK